MKQTMIGIIITAMVITLLAGQPAFASAQFLIIDLGTLGGTFSNARAINDNTQIVGGSDTTLGESHAFLWENGVMTDLGTLGGTASSAGAINNLGQIAGMSQIISGKYHAFLWENDVMIDLGTLGGTSSYANSINETGQVVGYSRTASGETHAFLWENSAMIDLGTLGGSYSQANSINNRGQIVGSSTTASGETHAFLWENSIMTDLGTLAGGVSSGADDINEYQLIVGWSETTSGETRAFLWENGIMTDLGKLRDSDNFGQALTINDQMQIAGSSGNIENYEFDHAFIWEDSSMSDLGTLGGSFSTAFGINSDGQIVGFSTTSEGEYHAVLWNKNSNKTPIADAGGPYTAYKGETITLDASNSYDPDGDPLTYEWDLNNDGSYDDATNVITDISFANAGNYTVGLRVTDTGGLSATATADIAIIDNLPPEAIIANYRRKPEGNSFQLNAFYSSDPEGGPLTYEWDLDNDGQYDDAIGVTANVVFGDNGGFSVGLRVTDNCGLSDTDKRTVSIFNVEPSVGAIVAPIIPIQTGTLVNISDNFTDPGFLDTHTATWDWGDGMTSEGVVDGHDVSGSHVYGAPGVYTLTLTVADDDGGIGTATFQYVVVYDPNGGFVTGSGWINSPEGAYTPDPTLTGKATFGFVSKYQKGANVPTGVTGFQFNVADFYFESTSYDWLVIASDKAQYKGTGTINSTGEYKFMLTAIDGISDMFRIKIWDKETGAIIYDNMLGEADNVEPYIEIGGGAIVIHKPK